MLVNYQQLFDLTGKHALVIGAGSGLGQAAAFGLAAHGARLSCLDLDKDKAEQTAREVKGAHAFGLDIRDLKALREFFANTSPLDIVVCTPSINVRKPLLDYSEADFDKVINLNLKASFFALQEAGKHLAARGKGSIILFSSIRAQVVEPGQSVYAASKAASVQLVRTLAAELGPQGVRVNAIAPGVVETPLTEPIKAQTDWYQAYAEKSALKRWAKAEELAGPVVFLASEASSFITGSLLMVDGGWTAIDGRFSPPL